MADADEKRMVRNAGMLSALTMISRILGLVREMTKAAFLGTGGLSDAFSVSFMIPNFMRRLFAENSISVAFIPTFKTYLHDGEDEKTREFLSSSLTVLLILVGAVVAAGMAASSWIVLAFGSDPGETAILTRIMFPYLGLVSIAALFQGMLNSYGIFAPSGLAPILFNLCFILVPMLVSRWTVNPARAMAIGVVAGGFAQAACQLPALLRAGMRFGFISPRRAFANPGMKKVFVLIAPTILGMAAYQINDLVSTAFASRAGVGVASSLQFSIRLQELILGIFAVSAGTVLLPELADAAKALEWKRYSARLGQTLKTLSLVTVPVAVFSIITCKEIVALLFMRGGFTAESVELTASAFLWHQTGLAFIAANRVIAPAFYARSDSKTPAFAGIGSFAVNIALVAMLAFPFKGPGIAFALSFSSAVNCAILIFALLRKKTEGISEALSGFGRYSGKLLAFSLAAGVPVFFLREPLLALFDFSPSRLVSLGLPFLVMTLLYAVLGLGLLVVSKDKTAAALAGHFSRRAPREKT
ncbi:MAG: murein biosynthesis integral membrane protein MurJ [Spirochaetia bacterium]|nr:murein biosynthesis integral membrane protein MurJ [Spirochaetia bacterium]MCE1209919.1 murein biosynthesis integral membrane protein MurJ [Spirochaetia bacterium]